MDNNVIRLPELTEEALQRFLDDEIVSVVLDNKTKELIKELFQKDKTDGFKSGLFQVMR